MQNKAEALPAWLQLAAGAAAGAQLSLAIVLVAMVHKTGMMQGMQNAAADAANKGYVEQQHVN